MSYEYHQLLKYVYFEGYADSYEEADYLLEQLNDEEFDELCENVSGGRSRRASSRRAPISQRVTDTEAEKIRQNARENPKPSASAPEDDSREAMQARFKAETDAENAEKEAKRPKTVPSRGIGASERVLRKGKKHTPGGTAQARVTELNRRRRQQGKKPYAAGDAERVTRISAALKKRDKWGTPEAAKEEFVIDYLVTEGYTDNYDSAIAIYESMSEEWLDTILEVKGRGRVLMRSTRDAKERGMKITPERKLDLKLAQVERQYPGDGSLEDLENIEQRIQKMRTVKDTPSMRKRVDNVRNITKRYKR